ncbi:glycosyltransferase family 4 protein [Arthrobacter sp. AL08]|uniref:glycosyltransferase family 4 protein n=1 Tax=unclassified Arthrobacter TaxID=235627 RepID=UPI00249BF03A|nr:MULTISPECIES: glycosyltransferase family 4 protein [unclassified Arthrobacter]MDI3242489.1 glycosyltransferase family 4 protein [Arthrobacter sp. AL05]MDI3278515.1 glycosyltransferase family 4 protein [Arthrobacter sp. AL08]
MIQLFRNLRMAVGVAGAHLTDDPVLLLQQISRRLPARVVQPLAAGMGMIARPRSTAVPVLLAALLRGDAGDLGRRLNLAVDGNPSKARAGHLTDIAVAANLPELADRFLAMTEGTPRLKRALARRFWYDGALTAGIDSLNGAGRGGRRQLAHFSAEASVLEDWTPVLERRSYEPVRGRVLHLLTNSLPHTASGYAQRSHSILRAQQDAGWEVMAVTRIGYPVQVGKLLAKSLDLVDDVSYRRLLPSKLAATADARLQQQAEELLNVALEFKPSVLHTTTHYINGLVVRAVAEALGIPWVYEVRGQLADTWASSRGPAARESEKYRLFQKREVEIMQDADLVVTLGETMKANIIAAGVPSRNILIAPNAVGEGFLQEPPSAAAARCEIGLPAEGQFIGTVSSLVPYEGIDDLIGAFCLLARSNLHLRLLIVGDGASMPSLVEQAQQSGFGPRILFTGRVSRDEAIRYHQSLDVFVVPRKDLEVTRSVTPLKPVEALACGRPVVASRLPALEEIVRDQVNGLLVSAESPESLAAALGRILADEPSRQAMGRAGREDVLRTRTWAANAQLLVAAYHHLEHEEY